MHQAFILLIASICAFGLGSDNLAVLPLDFRIKVNGTDGNNTNGTNVTNETSCVWSSWTDCSHPCGGGIQSRTQTCDDEDDDRETQDLQQKRTCNTHACGAPAGPSISTTPSIIYKGPHSLGQWFIIELSKARLPDAILEADEVDVALIAQADGSQASRRGLLDIDNSCAQAFNGAQPIHMATTNLQGRWEVALKSTQAGRFTCCLRAPSGVVAPYAEPLVVQGPTHIDISGVECRGTSSPIDITDASAISVQVAGINLQTSDAWGLVQATKDCPPSVVVPVQPVGGAISSRSTSQQVALPGPGPVGICYRYGGAWFKIPTCAAVRALATSTNAPAASTSTDSPNWAIIGSVLAVVGTLAVGSIWGLIAYRRHKAQKMETMFSIVSEGDHHESGACATPVNKSSTHSNASSRQSSALRSRYVSPMKTKPLTPIRAPATSPSRRSPSTFLLSSPHPSPFGVDREEAGMMLSPKGAEQVQN